MRWHDPQQDALAAANRTYFVTRRPAPAWILFVRLAIVAAVIAGAVAWMTHAS